MRNLSAEMARFGVSYADLMELLNCSQKTVSNKLNDVTEFSVSEPGVPVRPHRRAGERVKGGVKTMVEKLRALANDILEKCQKQGLTFQETKTLLMIMEQRVEEGREKAWKDAGEYKLKFRTF